jgi:hypothetical protein
MSKLELFQELFYLDRSSPSYLRWKIYISNRCKAHSVAGHLGMSGYWWTTYKRIKYPVATVVLSLYSKEYYEDMTVDHIDRCPSNNCPSNLRWCNKSEQGFNRRSWGFKTMDNSLNAFEKSR